MRLLGFAFMLVPGLTFASGKLAYLLETENGIDVVVANADGTSEQVVRHVTAPIPSISSDGQYILYPEPRDSSLKDFAVVTKNLVTGEIEQWSDTSGWNLHTNFNHSSTVIAYASPSPETGLSRIAYFKVDESRAAGPLRKVTTKEETRLIYAPLTHYIESEHALYAPFFSSDGQRAVYQVTVNPDSKYIVEQDLRQGTQKPLTPLGGRCEVPTFSFDNQMVSYTCLRGENWDVYAYDRKLGRELRVTSHPGRDQTASFSPDGDIVFSSNRSGKFDLYRVSVKALSAGVPEAVPFLARPNNVYYASFSGEVELEQDRLSDIPEPARSSFGAVKVGRRVYLAGGHQGREHHYPKESFLSDLVYYDLDENTWHQARPRPTPSQGFELAEFGGKIYAFGGFAFNEGQDPPWRSLDEIDEYDPATDSWKTVGKLPRRRSSYVMEVVGTRAYLLGGWDSTPKFRGDKEGRFHDEIDVYDLLTGEVSTPAEVRLPKKRRAFSSVRAHDKILLLGGISEGASHFELLDLVTEFDPKTLAFRDLAPLPTPNFAPAAAYLNEKLYVFGGMHQVGKHDYDYVDHIISRTADEREWQHSGRYLSEAKGFSIVVPLDENEIAIFGGHHYFIDSEGKPADQPVRTVEVIKARN